MRMISMFLALSLLPMTEDRGFAQTQKQRRIDKAFYSLLIGASGEVEEIELRASLAKLRNDSDGPNFDELSSVKRICLRNYVILEEDIRYWANKKAIRSITIGDLEEEGKISVDNFKLLISLFPLLESISVATYDLNDEAVSNIQTLKHLRELHLSVHLSKSPNWIGDLLCLERLSIEGEIDDTVGVSLGRLSSLKSLTIYSKQLTSKFIDSLLTLNNGLVELQIGRADIPLDCLPKLSGFRNLHSLTLEEIDRSWRFLGEATEDLPRNFPSATEEECRRLFSFTSRLPYLHTFRFDGRVDSNVVYAFQGNRTIKSLFLPRVSIRDEDLHILATLNSLKTTSFSNLNKEKED